MGCSSQLTAWETMGFGWLCVRNRDEGPKGAPSVSATQSVTRPSAGTKLVYTNSHGATSARSTESSLIQRQKNEKVKLPRTTGLNTPTEEENLKDKARTKVPAQGQRTSSARSQSITNQNMKPIYFDVC